MAKYLLMFCEMLKSALFEYFNNTWHYYSERYNPVALIVFLVCCVLIIIALLILNSQHKKSEVMRYKKRVYKKFVRAKQIPKDKALSKNPFPDTIPCIYCGKVHTRVSLHTIKRSKKLLIAIGLLLSFLTGFMGFVFLVFAVFRKNNKTYKVLICNNCGNIHRFKFNKYI